MNAGSLSIVNFVAEVARRFDTRRPHTFWQCEDLLLRLLENRKEIQRRYNEELRSLIEDPNYVGDWLPNEWVLHRGGGIILSVSLLSPRRFIHVLPFYAMYGSLGTSGLSYHVYRLPANYRNEVFDPSVRLEELEQRSSSVAEAVRIESDLYAYDFKPTAVVPVLKFMTGATKTLEWLFSRESLRAWQANDANLNFTQLRVAADVLGTFAHHSSMEALQSITHHPHHAVRWSAIQNLARVNRSAAIKALRGAADDPHPHIRAAALKTLERLQLSVRETS